MEFIFPKAQAAKLLLLILSLTLIPFVSTSFRSSYLYFLLNILIIVLGYESGILHVLMEPDMDKKKPVITVAPMASLDNLGSNNSAKLTREGVHERPVAVAKQTLAADEKAMIGAKAHNMKKAPSVPSLFFIGSCDEESDAAEDIEEEEEDVFVAAGEISAQELFARAESFIGNFYKQLKIQREESWKKIHGFYHKTL